MSFIIGKYYGGDPRVKPDQWGPAADVQAAINENAAGMGIDPGSIALCMPMWGPGKQIDYAQLYSGANSGATYAKNHLSFDGNNDYVTTPKIFPERKATIFIPSISFQTANQFNRIFHSCIDTANNQTFGVYVQFTSQNKIEITYTNGAAAGALSRRNLITTNSYQANKNYSMICVVRDAISDMSVMINGQGQAGTYAGSATTYDPGTKTGGVGIHEYNGALYYGHVSMDSVFCFNAALSDTQIAHLSDNPYALIQPIVRRFYSIPNGDVLFAINDISQAQTVQSQSLPHITEINIAGVSQSQVSSAISLNQLHDLTIETLSQGQSISTSALLQLTELTIDALNHGQVVESPVLDQLNTLSVDVVLQGQATNDLTLAQKIELTVADITQLQDIDVVSLTLAGVLTIHSILQSQGLSSIALDQQVEIAIHGIAQGQTIGATGLSQLQSLLITDIAQAHSIDVVTMEIPGALVINSILQDQSISQPTMAQTHGLLTVASIGQGQSVSVAALDQVHTLAVNNIDQSQGFSSPALDQLIQLGINSVSQGQVIDSQSFFQVLQLSIDNVLQSQRTELLTVSQISDLIIDNVNQGIVIDGITFSIAQGRVTVTITTRQPEVNFGAR